MKYTIADRLNAILGALIIFVGTLDILLIGVILMVGGRHG